MTNEMEVVEETGGTSRASAAPVVVAEKHFFEERNKELLKLAKLGSIIYATFFDLNVVRVNRIDIDRSCKAAGALATVYTYLRKRKLNGTGPVTLKYGAYTLAIGKVSKTVAETAALFDTAIPEGFDFKIATPLMNLLTCFKMCLDEARVGVTKVTLKKEEKATKNVQLNISKYGLGNTHIPLLYGLTFQPERRTALLHGLGPLTLCIQLMGEKQYFDKTAAALERSISMLPMASQIATAVRTGTKESCRGLLRELGDLLLLTSHRSTRRICFPLEFFLRNITAENLLKLNFTGIEGIKFYMNAGVRECSIKTAESPEVASQMVFHAMFGTYLEDLGLVEKITNSTGPWLNRRASDTFFQQRESQNSVSFTLKPMIYASKMVNANPTNMLGTVQPMLINGLQFAGKRKRKYTEAFLEYNKSGSNIPSFSSDPASLSFAMRTMRTEIMNNMNLASVITVGTTNWLHWNNTTGVYEETEEILEETGVYFFS